MHTTSLAFIGNIGWPEIIILSVLGVLIFGRRLPEVGRSVGKGIVEFKKGLSGITDDTAPGTPGNISPPKEAQLDDKSQSSDTLSAESPQETSHTKES